MNLKIGARRLQGIVHNAGVTVREIFPLGITARLTLSFIAVTVLAATANLIARESVSVVLFSRPVHELPPAQVVPPTISSQAAPLPAQIEKKRSEALAAVADRFELASELRAEANSVASVSEYVAAEKTLRAAANDFPVGSLAKTALERAVTEYIDRGRQVVLLADQRRAARLEYSKLMQAMSDRLQSTLEGAWKIFGRVIARQSLIELRVELDAIREHGEGIILGESVDAGEIKALTASEDAFAASFARNETRFMSAEGAAWVKGTKADFDELVALRLSLASLNSRYNDALHRFSQNHGSLFAAISIAGSLSHQSTLRQGRFSSSPPAPAAAIASAPAVAPAPAPAPLQLAPSPDELLAATAIRKVDHHARDLMAGVTAIVLLLVTLISVLTVRSVVRPVRMILRGTSTLGAGNHQVHVPRGGIRELDTLAEAFNDMAARIASTQAARRIHAETLEEAVLERTHKLQTLAQQDPLTSLPNRRHLSTLLDNAVDRARRENRHLGIYFLDVDNFKNFNDSLGHVFGDRVLMSVANRLEEFADGLGFVARLGGDEFTLVHENAESERAVHETGLRLVETFQQLLSVDGREFSVSVSVGASIFPEHGHGADELLRAADSALYHAKEMGRSRLALFTPELIQSAAARFDIEQGLRRALERGEFELVYQPEVDLATMRVDLVEALIRWRMPDGRLAAPGEFLAVAEQSGLITDISKWVLRAAVQAAAQWHHGAWPGARVAINISPRQLLDPRFADSLAALLREFALPACAIELELTETVMQTGAGTIAALRLLHSQGYGIALDDFGTGYSSLTSLEQLPLSRIKLDRSLIASIDSSPRAAAIARAIIDLCEGLGLAVTAEGVERPAQLAWLLTSRSIFVQGFLLSDAVPFEEVLRRRAVVIPKLHNLLLSLGVESYPRSAADLRLASGASGKSAPIPIHRAIKS
ncbi:MAG: EAL domain-containing protein [Pseudomonadota bacterium]|nr:EAL domain-containing protein [Pseudomonadota bacterium]